MKRLFKKSQKVIKGMPSAVVLSILIHAGLFFLAGGLVIFKVLNPPPVEFKAPPPVKVPKMPLKKLTPKVKKPSKPKSTAKIVAVLEKVDLNRIQFPDLASSGIGTGISEGSDVVEFDEMPTFEDEEGLLGGVVSTGNDLEGRFYDIKRRRSGTYTGMGSLEPYLIVVNKFFNNDWDPAVLAPYYRAPRELYASSFLIPTMSSSVAPVSFGEDRGSGGYWVAHYKGKLVYPEDITFRFCGSGDMFVAVRVNGKMVLFAVWVGRRDSFDCWRGDDPRRDTYYLGHSGKLEFGDWVTLKAGEPQDIEILLGDAGNIGGWMLLVEVEGVDYPQNIQAGPILPAFKMEEFSHDQLDAIYKDLSPNECSLTNGPIFRDY